MINEITYTLSESEGVIQQIDSINPPELMTTMGMLKKYSDKLYLKQWSLGFLKESIAEIIRSKKTNLSFQWVKIDDRGTSYADPFIFKTPDGRVNVLFESVSSHKLDGKISLMVCDEQLMPVEQKVVLETNDHLSYPFVYRENGRIYVFPENAFSGSLFCYEFDPTTRTLVNQQKVMDLPILDPTIIRHNNKYWMFGTMLGKTLNSHLHIFYSDNLCGPYTPHAGNPVKKHDNGTRPAGNFIEVDGTIYRPTQNCSNYYGESLTINRVVSLTPTEFVEEGYMVIKPNKDDAYNYGIHTINIVDDIIIVDGQRTHFQPVQQLMRKLKTLFA